MFNGPLKLAAISAIIAVIVATYLGSSREAGHGPLAGLTDRFFSSGPSRSPAKPEVAVAKAPTAPAFGFGPVRLPADKSGHYLAVVEIEGRSLRMLVDTGATYISLSHRDAMALGLQPLPSDFKNRVVTANGEIMVARTQLREVRLSNILVRDVPAAILPPGIETASLLGMSFLSKLRSFEVADGSMVLNP
ncbi:TIGR02281 family clan AA aspartic protease [Methylocella sp. CPCC 101449]|jgi:aspartyl protease family protein|uniref:retropepsin-like aspartic protease family protein n=1 Tax=Methylocella sp. CPCC 101449 TaxID=2987531 RepID=UPI002890F999|nr:TIGR02281 family clan AA aspartic protease [Methylocella sp. CPCC 101449]MDT2019940.1 TIGR02281 family clan AA aspartic protease [Methylocella sp. CPCC 101449]HEV2575154.1 TIGR02281 family clan AA aspartic protease [Beijerinckiaceae bacterium]